MCIRSCATEHDFEETHCWTIINRDIRIISDRKTECVSEPLYNTGVIMFHKPGLVNRKFQYAILFVATLITVFFILSNKIQRPQ
jgi:hypothetical protein